MKAHSRTGRSIRPLHFLVAFDEQTGDDETLVIPEDLSTLTREELDALAEQATEAFEAIRGDGTGLTDADLEAMRGLAEGIERLREATDALDTADAERAAEAAALAERVNPVAQEDDGTGEDGEGEADAADTDAEEGDDGEGEDAPAEVTDEQPDAVAASSREVRVNLSGLRSRQARTPARPTGAPQTMRDIVHAGSDVSGYANGMDFNDMARAIDKRLQGFKESQYAAARRNGNHLREQFSIAVIDKPFRDGMVLTDAMSDSTVDEVMRRAADERNLPKGSLVASGGWCAPSETRYDLLEMETRDGLIDVPEVGVRRGGIRRTLGPDFSTLFTDITGFHYTEAQDIAGTYGVDADGMGDGSAGDKPCYKVDCPDWEDFRLDTAGLCITAGLLQSRGFPEMIARTIRGALIAHDHRLSGFKVDEIVAGSTAVSFAASQVGATAPLLTAVELQVNHMRSLHRLSMTQTVEAVFPFWVKGLIRADLSRRLGLAEFDVTDQRIMGWFAQRGVRAQFIYNWQTLETDAASAAIDYATEVDFLLYPAGTWIVGGGDVITLDTIYDSVLLGQNDYTALFTEEGIMVVKMGHDSRVVTVPVCPNGGANVGQAIDCDGSVGA